MSKRHKPITQAQIGLLKECAPYIQYGIGSNLKEVLIAQAIAKKGLTKLWWFPGEWQDDHYYEEGLVLSITPLGKRYLRFIAHLATKEKQL